MTPANLVAGFKATGIYALNPAANSDIACTPASITEIETGVTEPGKKKIQMLPPNHQHQDNITEIEQFCLRTAVTTESDYTVHDSSDSEAVIKLRPKTKTDRNFNSESKYSNNCFILSIIIQNAVLAEERSWKYYSE